MHFSSPRAPSLTSLRSRLGLWLIVVGVVGGLGGAAFIGAVKLTARVLAPTNFSPRVLPLVLLGVGLTMTLLIRLLGKSGGGVDLLVDNIHVLGGAAEIRGLRSLIPVSILGIAAGGALGPEAPMVESTGTFGTWLGRRQGLGSTDIRVLTITGMAAGFAVLFGAPIGSAIFALEILHRRGLEYYEALIPSLIGAVAGYIVYVAVSGIGIHPLWTFPHLSTASLGDLMPAALMGIVGAALATAFMFVSRLTRKVSGLMPEMTRPAAAGLVLGLLALWSPYALGFGEHQVKSLLSPKLTIGALAIAGLAKLLASTTCMAGGWKGGFIIPLFFIGAAAGHIVHLLAPGTNLTLVVTAGMVATCVGVTKTPIGSTLIIAETGGLAIAPMLLIASLLSLTLTGRIGQIEAQRHREIVAQALRGEIRRIQEHPE